jgi:hypothetical protein
MAKPLEERKYLTYLKFANWRLEKSGFDYNLCNENGHF